MDLKMIYDCKERGYHVWHCIGLATSFHVAAVVDKFSAPRVWSKFQRRWFAWAGAPRKLLHDQGGEFQG
eukprot:12824712-Alexandrium_andersonii.AAC.1